MPRLGTATRAWRDGRSLWRESCELENDGGAEEDSLERPKAKTVRKAMYTVQRWCKHPLRTRVSSGTAFRILEATRGTHAKSAVDCLQCCKQLRKKCTACHVDALPSLEPDHILMRCSVAWNTCGETINPRAVSAPA